MRPCYDLVFLDGCKNWSTDGLAVVLAEKLLRPGGWLLLDDLGWSYGKNPLGPTHYGIEIAALSDEERQQPHLRAIFDLLIRNNPAFDTFEIQDDWWGWARKSPGARRNGGAVLSGKAVEAGAATAPRPTAGPRRERRGEATPLAGTGLATPSLLGPSTDPRTRAQGETPLVALVGSRS